MEKHKNLLDREYEQLLTQFSKDLERLQVKHQEELAKTVRHLICAHIQEIDVKFLTYLIFLSHSAEDQHCYGEEAHEADHGRAVHGEEVVRKQDEPRVQVEEGDVEARDVRPGDVQEGEGGFLVPSEGAAQGGRGRAEPAAEPLAEGDLGQGSQEVQEAPARQVPRPRTGPAQRGT